MLCSCGGGAEETTIPEPETEEATTEQTVQGNYNPLNGTALDEPYTGRVFAVTMNNVSPAIPHKGLGDADIFFEMYINDYCTRGLALFSDVKSVSDIGSIRSNRMNFTDIAQGYDCVLFHTGGSDLVMNDLYSSGVENMGVDVPVGYRDSERSAQGYAWEHTLFATGESLYNAAQNKGFRLTSENKNYGLTFAAEGTPDGETAASVEILFTISGITKKTTMTYDSANDGYTFNQYGKTMTDKGETVYFKNVVVITAPTENIYHGGAVYHVSDLIGTGDGYFACGGKYIAVKWSRASESEPFTFTAADGSAVNFEIGSSYIAIAPTESPVNIK